MRIAMMTNNYKPYVGGVPISIDRLAAGLRKLGHEVYIFAPSFEGEEEEEYVIRYHSLKKKLKKEFTIPNIFDPMIEEKFRELSFDLIHVHHPMLIGYIARYLGKKYNVPVVLTYHTRYEHYLHYLKPFEGKRSGSPDHRSSGTFRRRLISAGKEELVAAHNRMIINHCDMVFVPSLSMKEYLVSHGTVTDIGILPTGIPGEEFEYDPIRSAGLRERYGKDVDYLFCTVSRLEKEKNIEFLLEGLKLLKESGCNRFRMLMIGEGTGKQALEDLTRQLELNQNVTFCGRISHDELRHYYHACDAFLFASTSETQGIVLLEAMAAGLPIIAVKASGVKDVVTDGWNGFAVPPDTRQWVDKLRYIIGNQRVREKMREHALEEAKTYLSSNIASRALQYYQDILYQKRMEPDYEYATSYEAAGGIISYLPGNRHTDKYDRDKK